MAFGNSDTGFKPERASQAISPCELPPSMVLTAIVSNPNGLPRPFRLGVDHVRGIGRGSFQTRTGFPGHFASKSCENHSTVAAAFQTRTGFPGHFAIVEDKAMKYFYDVSNPNGLPRPFRLLMLSRIRGSLNCFKPERASQAISPSIF